MIKIWLFQIILIISIIITKNDTNNYIYIRKLNNDQKKNLVIGAFTYYPWFKIKNFFISLIQSNFENCDFVMFLGRTSQETKEKLKSIGIIVYDIPEELIRYNVQNSRWKIYEDFLSNNTDKYNMVFTADIKDTFFQKDIFKYYKDYNKPFLGVFYEESIIKNRPMNCDWVRFYSGQENLEKIYLNRIICSGTLIGTIDKFIEFCNILWKTMKDKNDLINIRDQGAVNYIIYYLKYFNDCLIPKDNYGPLMTIGLSNRDNLTLDQDDNIINYSGQVAAVIHQYNRHEDIVNKISNKYNEYNLDRNNNKNIDNINDNEFIIQEKNITQKEKGFIMDYKIIAFIMLFLFIIIYLKYLNKSIKRNKRLFLKRKRKFKKVKTKIFEK